MITRVLAIALLLSMSWAAIAAEEKPTPSPARSISAAPPGGLNRGRLQQPTVITSKEELAKIYTDEKARNAILEQVDLTKEQLLLFAWAGSGQDKIEVDEKSKAEEVIFRYLPGRTRDLRPHFQVYAIAADAKWKVNPGR